MRRPKKTQDLKTEPRIRLLSVGFILAILVISGRLFFWQVVKGEELSSVGKAQQQNRSQILAKRGDILAKDGAVLAASIDAWRLVAMRPQFDSNPSDTANTLAELFANNAQFEDDEAEDISEQDETKLSSDGEDSKILKTAKEKKEEYFDSEKERIRDLLSNNDLMWIPLKSKISLELRKEIEALGVEGLYFEDQEDRAYPEASAAAHLLGFVGKDDDGLDKGYFGLEGYYDISLTGKAGFKSREANALGAPIIFGASKQSAALEGVDLITHIDKTIQIIIEKHLELGIKKYGAISGNIIVMRPRDGAIIAMATNPTFDPKKYYEYSNDLFRNPIISDSFEPGSIFKPIIMAAGLDAGVVTPSTVCDICDRPYQVDKYFIRTWNNEYNAGSTMADVIIHSDNVGMAYVGNKLGPDKLYDYLENFGLGRITGIDLQGEVSPEIRSKGTWSIVDLATTTFGQGIAVTPIQMVKALSVIANHGREATPQIVDRIQIGDEVEDIAPDLGKQVISEQAARDITNMMTLAVKDGEAKWAVPSGFSVAGKTGTAQIPVAGHYDEEKTIASFVGFAPPSDPEFLMLITLREPKSSPWASETAAPLWFDIAKDIFPYLGIQPDKE